MTSEPVSGRGIDLAARDYDSYRMLMDLWSRENPIKTNKLQVLLVVNGLLVSAVNVSGGGFTKDKWFLYLAGAVFSSIWTLSIGRTALFQEAWQMKLEALREAHPDDPRFAVHRTRSERARAPTLLRYAGKVPSSWYLVCTPVVFALVWLLILAVTTLLMKD
jgi:hypothetical protein